jgi:hypothetical protein
MVLGQERTGKSSLSATLADYPEPGMHPLILAVDPTGPDSCLALGYHPHRIVVQDQPGAYWYAKVSSALSAIELNFPEIKKKYGCIVVDDLSSMSYRFLEDATKDKNPDPRSHYFMTQKWMSSIWYRLSDLDIDVVYLGWPGERYEDSKDKDKKGGGGGGGAQGELAPPDIAGRKFARSLAGRTVHNFILERKVVGKGTPGADEHGFLRVLHSIPWNGINAGGRRSHLLPEPCPAHLGLVLAWMTGRAQVGKSESVVAEPAEPVAAESVGGNGGGE